MNYSTTKIKSIKKIGSKPTMDLEVNHPSHVFYTEGIAVSNSHSDSYAKNGYMTAYIKAHFPLAFYGAWLVGANWKGQDKYEEIHELVNDAKMSDIEVCTPYLPDKKSHIYINNKKIRFGLSEIKDIGAASIPKIFSHIKEAEKRLNKSFADFSWIEYCIFLARKIGAKANKALIYSGALDFFGVPRNYMNFQVLRLADLKEDTELAWLQENYLRNKWVSIPEALIAMSPPRKRQKQNGKMVQISGCGTSNTKREKAVLDLAELIQNPPSQNEKLDFPGEIAWNETKYLGVPITYSTVDGCEGSFLANTTCREFVEGKNGFMLFAVAIKNIKTMKTKRGKNPGQEMATLTMEDGSGIINSAVCFPDVWKKHGDILYENNTLLIHGEPTKNKSLSILDCKEIK